MADAYGEFRPELSLVDTQPISLCEALNRILNKGVVVVGEATISVADIDLIYLELQVVLTSVETARGSADGNRGSGFLVRGPSPTNGRSQDIERQEQSSHPLPALSPDRNDAPLAQQKVGSAAVTDFPRMMQVDSSPLARLPEVGHGQGTRMRLQGDKVKNGLAQLLLTLVRLLHEILKHQATRRVEGGSLSDAETERLGLTLMRQAQEIERLRKEFGLIEEDLNIDLGPVGKLL